jgi:hypothetical protein
MRDTILSREMRIELHCHSTCSDGTLAAEVVGARAAAAGAQLFALTDHDTCAGTAAAVVPGARIVRGVELSCDDRGRTIHVLAYDRGGDWAALEGKLDAVREARRNRLRVMAAKLVHRGIVIDIEPLLAEAGRRSVGRPDLARAMVAAGHATSFKDAFQRHLFDGGPVDVAHHALPLVDALAAGRAANAAMSLAHPHLYGDRGAQLLRQHRDDGLTGVEAFYGGYDPSERGRWTKLAGELKLTCTGGSDWHGETDSGPTIELDDARADAVLTWLSS